MPIQNIVLLTPSIRQNNPSPFTSSGVQIPVSVLNLKFTANLLLADKLSVGLLMNLSIEHSVDGSTNWLPVASFGWTSYGPGGYSTNPDPYLQFKPTAYPQHFFRIIADIPQPLSVGATVDITT